VSTQLTQKRSPQAIVIRRSFGPPLPANVFLFKMPPSTQARVVSYQVKVQSALNGVVFQVIEMRDPNGTLVSSAALAPLLNIFVFGAANEAAWAGPEQARVPLFRPNILIGTIPKDLFALPGYEFSILTISGTAVPGRTMDVTIFLSVGND